MELELLHSTEISFSFHVCSSLSLCLYLFRYQSTAPSLSIYLFPYGAQMKDCHLPLSCMHNRTHDNNTRILILARGIRNKNADKKRRAHVVLLYLRLDKGLKKYRLDSILLELLYTYIVINISLWHRDISFV
jgi:hypothetical protein